MALIGSISGSMSGSLTTLGNGISYLKAGSNVTITSGSTVGGEHQIVIAASSGGSLTGIDDQSSSNDDQITITDNAVIINEDSDDLDFRIETNGADRAFFVDGGNDAITMFATAAERPGNALLFISGAKSATSAQDIDHSEGTHFGGDIVVTGSVFCAGDGNFATSIGTNGNIAIGNLLLHNGDNDTKIAFTEDSIITTVGNAEMVRLVETDSADSIEFNNAEADIDFIVNNTSDEVLRIDSTGAVFNEDSHNNVDFRVESTESTHAIFVDAGEDFVGIHADSSIIPGNSVLFVSGAKSALASQNPDNGDGAHFGGDIVVSGNIYNGGYGYFTSGIASNAQVIASTNAVVGDAIIHSGDDDTKIEFADDKITVKAGNIEMLTITEASDNTVVFNEGSDNDFVFRVESGQNDAAFEVDGADEKIGFGASSDQYGADTWLFVSGNTNLGDRQSAKGKVAVFGGGVVLSGSLIPGVDNSIDLGATTHRFRNIFTADLNLRNERGNWTLIEENEFISFRNNDTGKRYRMLMEEITGDGSYGPGNDGEM